MSVTFAKRSIFMDENSPTQVSFLNFDASLTHEEPKLVNNAMVAERDHEKLGKVEIRGDETKFYLKQFRGGRPGELIVDPYGMLSKPTDLSAFSTQRGERFCEYLQVREDLFNSYRTYIRTRDSRYLRGIEKAILDNDNL